MWRFRIVPTFNQGERTPVGPKATVWETTPGTALEASGSRMLFLGFALCAGAPGGERPKEFRTQPGQILLVNGRQRLSRPAGLAICDMAESAVCATESPGNMRARGPGD